MENNNNEDKSAETVETLDDVIVERDQLRKELEQLRISSSYDARQRSIADIKTFISEEMTSKSFNESQIEYFTTKSFDIESIIDLNGHYENNVFDKIRDSIDELADFASPKSYVDPRPFRYADHMPVRKSDSEFGRDIAKKQRK